MPLKSEPTKIDKILNRNKKLNLNDKVIVSELRKNSFQIISTSFSKSVIIYDLNEGVLKLKVINPIWKTELHLRKNQIVEKFNTYLGSNIIKDIVLH
ncbi:MAG: DciA family protein [Chlorobiota bacterium]